MNYMVDDKRIEERHTSIVMRNFIFLICVILVCFERFGMAVFIPHSEHTMYSRLRLISS